MFRHPAASPYRPSYGCSCGCGTCGDKKPGYGLTGSLGEPEEEWDYAAEAKDLTIACPDFDKAVTAYLKAKERFEATGSVFGIRVGGSDSKLASALRAMGKAKREGKAALTKCRNRELDTPIGGERGPTQRDYQRALEGSTRGGGGKQQVSGGGTSQVGGKTSPLVYVIGAGVAGLAVTAAVLVAKRAKRKEATA